LGACYNFPMKVSDAGEFGLINRLDTVVNSAPGARQRRQQLLIGIGDDAAAWPGNGLTQLATTDSLIQDVHFSLDTTSWEELGWKAMAVNLSDIAAMGGIPEYALISLAIPGDTAVEDVVSMYRGMVALAADFNVAIAGGDTCRSPVVAITVTVLGTSGSDSLPVLARSGARPGDKIAVTGYLGAAAGGLKMLTQKLDAKPEVKARLSQAFLRPCPRITEGRQLAKLGVLAAIDISDGLISDLMHICEMSQVGARIEIDRVPVDPLLKTWLGSESLEMALAGGEDYELLFTASTDIINNIKQAVSCPVSIIGEITAGDAGKVTMVDSNGRPFSLKKAGWEHFIT